MDTVHPAFRNIVAVNKLYEYFEMGICNTLEGPHGAYSQYLQDERANRICTSVTELKQALVQSFNEMNAKQDRLAQEIQENNARISQMMIMLSTGLQNVQNTVYAAQTAAAAQLDQANSHLSDIEKVLKTTAHNEYVALREANIDAYLLRRP